MVCGAGTTAISHLTLETVGRVQQATKLFYLAVDALTERYMHSQNPSAESLSSSYKPGRERAEIYGEIVERILSAVRGGEQVCVVLYGHPGVVAYAGHQAIEIARSEGFGARMLPGISAEDCLFADLGIDPVERGCLSVEATDLVVFDRQVDPTLDLIVWQVGFVGHTDYQPHFANDGLALLTDRLVEAFGAEHSAILYEAASFAVAEPVVVPVKLAKLVEAPVTGFSTLFVPAASSAPVHEHRRRLLAEAMKQG